MIDLDKAVSDMMDQGVSSSKRYEHSLNPVLCRVCRGHGAIRWWDEQRDELHIEECDTCLSSGRVEVEVIVDISIKPYKPQ